MGQKRENYLVLCYSFLLDMCILSQLMHRGAMVYLKWAVILFQKGRLKTNDEFIYGALLGCAHISVHSLGRISLFNLHLLINFI